MMQFILQSIEINHLYSKRLYMCFYLISISVGQTFSWNKIGDALIKI